MGFIALFASVFCGGMCIGLVLFLVFAVGVAGVQGFKKLRK